jgi:hypothetical protein
MRYKDNTISAHTKFFSTFFSKNDYFDPKNGNQVTICSHLGYCRLSLQFFSCYKCGQRPVQ